MSYAITRAGVPLCTYQQLLRDVRVYGWGLRDSISGTPGDVVLFPSRDDAQAWIESHRVFAGDAVVERLGGDGGCPPMPASRSGWPSPR